MMPALSLVVAISAAIFTFSASALAVTSKPGHQQVQDVTFITTNAANRAESDLQVRLIKNLLADEEINSEAYLAQIERMRKRLGQ